MTVCVWQHLHTWWETSAAPKQASLSGWKLPFRHSLILSSLFSQTFSAWMFPSFDTAAAYFLLNQDSTDFFSSSADLCLRKWDRWPHRASARHTDSDCSSDLMLRWNKHKEVQYVHLCDPPSLHYCQMATYLWKEVSTNIDLHVSEGTKRWKNRRVFSISVIQQMCSKSDKVIYKSGHKETHESIADSCHVHLLQGRDRRRSEDVMSFPKSWQKMPKLRVSKHP